MTKNILSEEWIKEYGALWNDTREIVDDTADLTMTVIYRLAEDPENRRAQIDVKDGEVVYAGSVRDDATPDFTLTAKIDVWQQLGAGKLGAKRAITMQKVKFQGPLTVALSHLSGLEGALRLFGRVSDTEWS